MSGWPWSDFGAPWRAGGCGPAGWGRAGPLQGFRHAQKEIVDRYNGALQLVGLLSGRGDIRAAAATAARLPKQDVVVEPASIAAPCC